MDAITWVNLDGRHTVVTSGLPIWKNPAALMRGEVRSTRPIKASVFTVQFGCRNDTLFRFLITSSPFSNKERKKLLQPLTLFVFKIMHERILDRLHRIWWNWEFDYHLLGQTVPAEVDWGKIGQAVENRNHIEEVNVPFAKVIRVCRWMHTLSDNHNKVV